MVIGTIAGILLKIQRSAMNVIGNWTYVSICIADGLMEILTYKTNLSFIKVRQVRESLAK